MVEENDGNFHFESVTYNKPWTIQVPWELGFFYVGFFNVSTLTLQTPYGLRDYSLKKLTFSSLVPVLY